jgi:hypothetical protein
MSGPAELLLMPAKSVEFASMAPSDDRVVIASPVHRLTLGLMMPLGRILQNADAVARHVPVNTGLSEDVVFILRTV